MPVFAWTATLLAAANFAAACREYTALRPSSIVMGGSNTLQTKAAKPVPRLTLSLGVARQCRLAAWLKTIEAVANLFWALQCCSKTLWVCSPIGWRTFNLGSHPGQLQTGGAFFQRRRADLYVIEHHPNGPASFVCFGPLINRTSIYAQPSSEFRALRAWIRKNRSSTMTLPEMLLAALAQH